MSHTTEAGRQNNEIKFKGTQRATESEHLKDDQGSRAP